MPSTATSSSQDREGGPRKYAYNREGARERETHLYLPYWGFSGSEKYAQQSVGDYPNKSRDNVLTVFAQLVALRMNAQRALISLFDKTSQHVIAEATGELSLRGAEAADRSDALWLGVRQVPRQTITMCDYAVNSFVEEGRDIFVSGDLTRDERFRDHPSVKKHPYNRFYVSVPIVSPDDYIIGSVAVLDDKPREGISCEQKQFLQELSATVMDHLLAQRAMREEYREEKMVRALGLFVKGKSNLSEWFYSREAPDKRYRGQVARVNKRLEQLQVSASEGDSGHSSENEQDGPNQSSGSSTGHSAAYVSPIQRYKSQGDGPSEDGQAAGGGKKDKKNRPKLSPTTSQLQDSLAPSNVRSVVNRAASMIYQALDVEGAMFIDASVYARRQTVSSSAAENDKSEDYNVEETQSKVEDDDLASGLGHPESHARDGEEDDNQRSRSLVLGHFTSSTSDSGVNLSDSHYISLSGGFISHLIDQYPRGKIFHLEEDGSISLSYEGLADEINYSHTGSRGTLVTEPDKEIMKQGTIDIQRLTKVLPDARCIAIYPVWDFQRGRWFTVCVVWTNDPGRVLSEPKDLTYLAAFSNTVMAEVSRLDLEAADRAKSDFISSISHELRSPLHGVLGTVELLQEMVNTYAQRSLVETIYSCGRTLLDTLNHLLDYAKINTLTRPDDRTKNGPPNGAAKSKPEGAVSGSRQDEDLSVLVQEVVEGLLAGAEYQRKGGNGNNAGVENGERTQLMTIVDIEWKDSWLFSVHSGAWRRVVMNLFGNALKYTRSGYIQLVMKGDALKIEGEKKPAVRITISDSGRGMSKDFLTHHLYSAFFQEDATSPGLGVGLHLVHQIIKSLQGTINFTSELGKGTSVDVVLPIEMAEESNPPPRSFGKLKEQLRGKTVALFTRSSKLGSLGFEDKLFTPMVTSLGHMISEWFGLRVLTADQMDSNQPDLAIVTEHEYRNYYREGTKVPKANGTEIQPQLPLIVLSAGTSSWEALGESVEDSVIFLTQPVSPKTLGTALSHCLGPSAAFSDTMKKPPPPVQSSRGEEADSEKETKTNGVKNAKRILLVDDNPVNLKIVEMSVKAAGFAHDSAQNGLEALEKFKKTRYDAVVMDISMPVMDGLTATREMRQFEDNKKLPPATIIIFTAALSASMQHEAMMSGVNLFLTKPTPLKRLKEMLRQLAEGKLVSQE
ncbi:putative sensor histidine kinase/response regulator [Aspergillus heterothallicus]